MDNKLLVSRKEAAKLLGISHRHLITLEMDGRLPQPRRLGVRKLYSIEELRDWIEQGCPSVEAMHRGPGVRC